MVFPLWDENPFARHRLPLVTLGLIAVNVVVFLYEVALPEDSLGAMVATFGTTPASIVRGINYSSSVPAYATLVTAIFLHADIWHLLGNMLFLFVFGDNIEEATGRLRFLVFYLLCGIGASLVFVASSPNSPIPLIGASGAIAGVLAAYLMLHPCAKILVFVWRIVLRLAAYWVIGAWILFQLWQILSNTQDEVAYMAHVGGLAFGAALFPLFRQPGIRLFQCLRPDRPVPPAA